MALWKRARQTYSTITVLETANMNMFKEIAKGSEEEKEFRRWARENYKLHTPINGVWHPLVQDECVRMNEGNFRPQK